MANFIFKIKDETFDLLKKLDAVQVWGEGIEDSDIEPPEDILKAEKDGLISKIQDKMKEKGLDESDMNDMEDSGLSFSLCIGRTEEKVKSFLMGDDPDGLFYALKKLGPVEVNGVKDKYFLYYCATF